MICEIDSKFREDISTYQQSRQDNIGGDLIKNKLKMKGLTHKINIFLAKGVLC